MSEQRRKLGRRLDDLLEVVEHEQCVVVANVLGQFLGSADRSCDRRENERPRANRPTAQADTQRLPKFDLGSEG